MKRNAGWSALAVLAAVGVLAVPRAARAKTETPHRGRPRRPREWVRDVDRVHDILQTRGEHALRTAMEDAMRCEFFGARCVEAALQRPLSFSEVIQCTWPTCAASTWSRHSRSRRFSTSDGRCETTLAANTPCHSKEYQPEHAGGNR